MHSDMALFAAVSKAAERRLSDFRVVELATTAWAFATLVLPEEKLFESLGRGLELRLQQYANAQDLSNTAWAFAKAAHHDKKLFVALVMAVGALVKRGAHFKPQHFANIA
eukprot:gnl/TRDRNA2_/TRDRNA2_174278_c13_seq3.p2 gnl/TRDRNA2_/TRDRNA2_174278_c13~~gnl/TRDRNA2_/TRDRNA2_174278_c13_seq3.p2  ORF type:complete len:110 (+),score=17.18 gnl/TRDRNA2_/TRDRNA2_174278_c13_seq3:360-689(+)